MENYERTFIASSKLFSGFRVSINITQVDNFNDIINLFKKELKNVLKENNFEILVDELKKSKFHIHTATMEDILTSSLNDIFYVCDHC